MECDNDGLAYTRYFREIKAYKELEKMTFWKFILHHKKYKRYIDILAKNFKENFNRKVSKGARL